MPTLDITPAQASLLVDVIDIWVAGTEQAKVLTTDDPTIETADQLLDLMSGYDEQLSELNTIRKKLVEGGYDG